MRKLSAGNWRKTVYYLKRNGVKNTYYAVKERLLGKRQEYVFCETKKDELQAQRARKFENGPLFSILVPLFRTPETYLRELIDSVLEQTYPYLELILADATEDDSVEAVVQEYMAGEKERYGSRRIRYQRLSCNHGISGNSNEALQLVTGDYVGLLDHDDVLTPDALYKMAEQIERGMERGIEPLLLYSDEDKCNQDRSKYFEPHYKPDFNLDLLLSNNYICHFTVIKRELIQKLGFRKEMDGAQDYDLILRAVFEILPQEDRIVHVGKILYHWRCHTGSTAENPQSKTYAYEAGKRALQDMIQRMGWKANAAHHRHLGFYRLEYRPDILTIRSDIGAVCGRLVARNGAIEGGAYDGQDRILYKGLPKGFGGYMHRAVLSQDVAAADIRFVKLRPECQPLLEELSGVPYTEEENGFFDWNTLPEKTDHVALSLRLGAALRLAGYRIFWDPDLSRKIAKKDTVRK